MHQGTDDRLQWLDMEEAHDKIQKISVDEKAEDENKNNFINGFMKKGFLENA